MDWLGDVLGRFRRDLRSLVVIWIAVIVCVVGYGVVTGGSIDNPVGLLLGMLVLGIAMAPIQWIRYEQPLVRGRHNAGRRTVAVVGLGCLWAVVALFVGAALIGALGVE
jgi:hypothetical protein